MLSFFSGYRDFFENLPCDGSDSEIFWPLYCKLREGNYFPPIDFSERLKSQEASIEYRRAGNLHLQESNATKALLFYTKSISKALFPSTRGFDDFVQKYLSTSEIINLIKAGSCELAFAFANRAIVLFSMGCYELCLNDIERAEKCGYPNHIIFKLLGRKARCSLKMGNKTDALKSCEVGLESLSQATTLTAAEKEKLRLEYLRLIDDINKLNKPEQKNTTEDDHTYFENIQVSYGQNKKIPSASNAIDITYHDEMGRGIIATRDIKVGDVIVVEKSFASNLLEECDKDVNYMYCSHCLMYCLALIPCYRCSKAMFCSQQCREESWKTYHHIECFLISIAQKEYYPTKFVPTALKVVTTASTEHKSLSDFYRWFKSVCLCSPKGFNERGQYISTDYRTIYYLETDLKKFSKDKVFLHAVQAACAVHFLDSKTKYFSDLKPVEEMEIKMFIGGLILRHIMGQHYYSLGIADIVQNNSVSDINTAEHKIGNAVCAVSNLFNHSCNANAFWTSYGNKIVIFASQSISNGEQIFISYKGMFYITPYDERRAILSKFHIECKCEACKKNWPLLQQLPSSFKCKSCNTDFPQFQGRHLNCRNCENVLKSLYVKIHSDTSVFKLESVKQLKHRKEKVYSIAKTLQEMGSVVEPPLQIYYLCHSYFLLYLKLWSSARSNVQM